MHGLRDVARNEAGAAARLVRFASAHEHGLRASPSPARRLADQLIGRLAAVVLCVSEADRDRLVTTDEEVVDDFDRFEIRR